MVGRKGGAVGRFVSDGSCSASRSRSRPRRVRATATQPRRRARVARRLREHPPAQGARRSRRSRSRSCRRTSPSPPRATGSTSRCRSSPTLKGPTGPIEGGLLADELHSDGKIEQKVFAPGYGEFYTAGGATSRRSRCRCRPTRSTDRFRPSSRPCRTARSRSSTRPDPGTGLRPPRRSATWRPPGRPTEATTCPG
jgi:hypothetical protein